MIAILLLLKRAGPAVLIAGAALLGACAPQVKPDLSAAPSSTTITSIHEHEDESVAGPARATFALGPGERARLALPATGSAVRSDALPPLDEAQWADPEAVAARFALVRTNYRTTEDLAEMRARSAPYVVPRLQQDLASSSGGEAALAELRAQDTAFAGDVVGLVTSERFQDRALVDLTIQRFLVDDGALDPEQVVFWRLTLVRDRITGHWLVAELQFS